MNSSQDSVIDRTRRPVEVPEVSPETPQWQTVDFKVQRQCHSNWCWAAVAASVAAFSDAASPFTQCVIANSELERDDCCDFKCDDLNVNPDINVPFMLGSSLDLVDCLREENPAQATRAQVLEEIAAGRPLCVLTIWSQDNPSHGRARGGAHFLAIVGYRADTDVLALEDPFYGPTPEIGFELFCDEYQVGAGRWDKTYYLSCDKNSAKA
jgi:hypothetical protein